MYNILMYCYEWLLLVADGLLLISALHCRLHTEERLRNHNRTVKFGPGSQPEHLIKRTTSGLLAICVSKGVYTII